MAVNDNQRDFHMEEFKQLRAEIASLIARVENFGKYSVILTASVFSWLATQSFGVLGSTTALCTRLHVPGSLLGYAWFIPFAVAALAGIMALVAFRRIVAMGDYISLLEIELGDEHLGWEAFLKAKPWTVTGATCFTWIALLVGTLYVGYVMQQETSSVPQCVPEAKSSNGYLIIAATEHKSSLFAAC